MDNPLDLSGKVAIVTGGGKGIGRGITERLLGAGADVLVCGRSQPEQLPAANGRRALFHSCDVREVEQIGATVEHTVSELGRLDILVNNAGGAPFADAATASPRFSEAIIRLNLIAPLNFSQAANAVMQTQDSGGRQSSAYWRHFSGPRPTAPPRPGWSICPPRWRSSGPRRSASMP